MKQYSRSKNDIIGNFQSTMEGNGCNCEVCTCETCTCGTTCNCG